MHTLNLFLGHDRVKRAGQVGYGGAYNGQQMYIEHARLAIDSLEFVFRFYGFLMRGVFVYKTAQDMTWRS